MVDRILEPPVAVVPPRERWPPWPDIIVDGLIRLNVPLPASVCDLPKREQPAAVVPLRAAQMVRVLGPRERRVARRESRVPLGARRQRDPAGENLCEQRRLDLHQRKWHDRMRDAEEC